MKLKLAVVAALLAGAASLPSGAQASVTITSTGIDTRVGSDTGGISYSGSPALSYPNGSIYVGRTRLIGTDDTTHAAVDFAAYCVDIFDELQSGHFDIQTYSGLSQVKRDQLLAVISNIDPLLTPSPSPTQATADMSAGIQLAVWEIVYEAGDSYSANALSTGLFTGVSTAGAVSNAATYLAGVSGSNESLWTLKPVSGYALNTLVAVPAGSNQNQVFLIASPVPEPATWGLMIGGFGLIGASLRTRRRHAQTAQA